MARPLRFQYQGACYHIMARGDGGKKVFENDEDRKIFIARLGEVCGRCGWKVHAWVLMGNHFHLLLETPEANLVVGMKWLLGTFSQGWNRARQRRGHVFQGRYKSVPVNGEDTGVYYFRIVADYIHLNPARAGLAGGTGRKLLEYKWSSLGAYAKGMAPDWLVMERVLRAFELAEDGRGRRAYVAWLEARAAQDGGKINDEAQAALRRGWYLGEESFKDKLLGILGRAKGVDKPRKARTEIANAHGEIEAERLIYLLGKQLELPTDRRELKRLRKSDGRKVLLAAVLRRRTAVGVNWIAERLAMGHPGSVSRMLGTMPREVGWKKKLMMLEEMLNSGD